MEKSGRDSREWGERVLVNKAGGKDLKTLGEDHPLEEISTQNGPHKKINKIIVRIIK